MLLTVNGTSLNFASERITVADLLTRNNVQAPEMVSVQRNGEFVERADYHSTFLADKDEIEFLYFLGGGQAQ